MPIMRVMILHMMLCFIAGWAMGSLAIYSYIALSARGAASAEMEREEEEEAIAA
ncbi:MAG: hypothetical protein Q7T82_17020 [Armatimonadota bacterium]|nr:hypothetical protein [Armatimonadota bacterium]